ncbi:hypothetical protein FHS07_002408 [Microbacterium proteolyticum]|uniref:Uncharacterized protein n=1 Tax=Microbacterium proteolyticum TaxID=1572644 RepID=A0A7W5GGW8_9MICO|nr:hypothetical protein [Microbacterium proteolyticum]
MNGLDLVTADADIYGWAVASLRGKLTEMEREELRSLGNRLAGTIMALPENAREYPNGLVTLARMAVEFRHS